MKAREIMSADVLSVTRDTSVEEIARILTENNVSGVPVMDGEKIVGMVTQRDMLYKDMEPRFPGVFQILGGVFFIQGDQYNKELKKVVAAKAEDIMTDNVVVVDEDTDVEKVAELMVDRGINRIPVVHNNKLVGIIARADVLRYIRDRMR